jgi:hypothetical protein
MQKLIDIERHELGPRVRLLGVRVHEYQVGFALLGCAPFAHSTLAAAAGALSGAVLVIKDWPDLFPSTRNKASWRLGIHRLPPT